MEVDLTFRGVDLLALFQECRVRLLLNLIDGLGRGTLLQEAMAQDDELVEQHMAAQPLADEDEQSSALRWSEFTPEVELLHAVLDRLGDGITATYAANGSKRPPRVRPLKRPETAWHRVERKRDLARHQRLVSRVLPNG